MIADHLIGIERFEANLWKVADNLRANSNLASNEYFLPILGLIFLRHATNRYYEAMAAIEEDRAAGKMPERPLIEADFTRRRALMLPEAARYDILLGLPKDYERFEDDVLEEMMRTFDSEALRTASGDVFGRIYEYFLAEFSKQLAQVNLAVHGLEGRIRAGNEAITYYKDPHELAGKCDFVMANPPFNVDEVDAEKIKGDKRLPFGLPGVNKAKKVSNANYLWLSYFYSYLNENGRAGVVMSSQASSAGRDEAKVRRKLIETGAVDVMIDIRGNFFYTRTVPCQLWFFDRAKERDHERANHVLLLDARNIYRKVSRAIYDFSPEQQQNIAAIVWLYRGQANRFLKLVESYLAQSIVGGQAAAKPLAAFEGILGKLIDLAAPFASEERDPDPLAETWQELNSAQASVSADIVAFTREVAERAANWNTGGNSEARSNAALHTARQGLHDTAECCRNASPTPSYAMSKDW